jgi:hypothetical protein
MGAVIAACGIGSLLSASLVSYGSAKQSAAVVPEPVG